MLVQQVRPNSSLATCAVPTVSEHDTAEKSGQVLVARLESKLAAKMAMVLSKGGLVTGVTAVRNTFLFK